MLSHRCIIGGEIIYNIFEPIKRLITINGTRAAVAPLIRNDPLIDRSIIDSCV